LDFPTTCKVLDVLKKNAGVNKSIMALSVWITILVVGYALFCLTGLLGASVYSAFIIQKMESNTKILGCLQCFAGNAEDSLEKWYQDKTGKKAPNGKCKNQCTF